MCTDQENWPGGAFDSEVYFSMAPNGCFYGALEGQQVGFIMAITYGDSSEYCNIGGLIVRREVQHRGYASKIIATLLSTLPKQCITTMSAVIMMERTYQQKYGHQSYWKENACVFDVKYISSLQVCDSDKICIVHHKKVSISRLVEYDRSAFGYSRDAYIKKLLEIPDSEGWIALNTNHEIVGYVIARKVQKEYGWYVAPLIAENKMIAEALFVEVARSAESNSIEILSLAIPEVNQNAMDFVEKFGGIIKFETVRMFSSDPPEAVLNGYTNKTYSINLYVG